MKKINNKGLTLIELIVSIALISVIMIFMYRLMANITFEKDNDYIATGNMMQRNEIINNIEKELTKKEIASITNEDNIIRFLDNENKELYSIIIDTSDTLLLQKEGQTIHKWKIKGGMIANNINCSSLPLEEYSIYSCRINIYTTNINNRILGSENKIDNNNTLDDISFSFKVLE